MKSVVITAAFVFGAGMATTRAGRPAAPANFSVLITATPTGWAARCDSGCHWKEVSFSCPNACPAIVDANGLVTLASPRPDPTPFSIVLHHDRYGAKAESRAGTAWSTLSWDCGESPCQVRVDAFGVGGGGR